MDLKKSLLWASVGATAFAGIVTGMIFLFGAFNDTIIKLLLSTVTIGWFGMTGSLTLTKEFEYNTANTLDRAQTIAGCVIALLGTGVFLDLIWTLGTARSWDNTEWKLATTLLSLSWALVWVAQLRIGDAVHSAVVWASRFSMASVVVIEFMTLILLWGEGRDLGEFFYRFLATMTVLAVTGTIVRFILRKATKNTTSAPVA